LVPNRHGSTADYRYGFQGQEKDDEIKGEGNSLNYTFRMHDPRMGRFFAVDPLEKDFPWNSPYAFAENKVIAFTELEGAESLYYQVSLDQKGKPDIKLVDIKESWLDPFVPYHLVVSINGGEFQYYSDFTQDDIDEGLMKERLEWIAKNPKLAQANIDKNKERAKEDAQELKETTINIFAAGFTGGLMKAKANASQKTPVEKSAPKIKNVDESTDFKGATDYSSINDPKNVNASTKPTPRVVKEMKRLNKENNGGVLKDDVTGEIMVESKKSKTGITPPSNEVQVDHKTSVKNGGTREVKNLNLRTRKNNRDKWHH